MQEVLCYCVIFYGAETWALTRALEDKVDAFDNICLRRIFRIPYTDHVSNAMVRLKSRFPTAAVSTHPV